MTMPDPTADWFTVQGAASPRITPGQEPTIQMRALLEPAEWLGHNVQEAALFVLMREGYDAMAMLLRDQKRNGYILCPGCAALDIPCSLCGDIRVREHRTDAAPRRRSCRPSLHHL
jgi:hypothetical protein